MQGLRHLRVHPDGKRIVFDAGQIRHETWVLENAHDALEHRAAEVHSKGCPATEVVALGRALRAHIEEESRVVRSASAAAAERLAQVAAWRADELFECAGGPTESWPGEWLG